MKLKLESVLSALAIMLTMLIVLTPLFLLRSCRSYPVERPEPETIYVQVKEPVEFCEERQKGPPKRMYGLYYTADYREHFKEHRVTLDKIVTMAREQKSEIRIGWRSGIGSMSRERENAYLALLRELGSTEYIDVEQDPFRVEVPMYRRGVMLRGYQYSPDEQPIPQVFVDDLEVGMKEHPDGWKIIYVPLGDGWYIYCNWD